MIPLNLGVLKQISVGFGYISLLYLPLQEGMLLFRNVVGTRKPYSKKKTTHYLSINYVFSMKVLIGHYLYVSYWRQASHFTSSSKPREV